MKITVILFILIGMLISGCKYEPIYSSKETSFQITKIEIKSKNEISLNIQKKLNVYTNLNSSKKIELEIDSEKIISSSSKDTLGNTKKFDMEIIVTLIKSQKGKVNEKVIFSENFKYNNTSNKFDLKKYENNIQQNLTNKIFQEMLLYLSSI